MTARSARLLASRLDSDLVTAGTWSAGATYLGGGMVSGAMKLDSVDAGELIWADKHLRRLGAVIAGSEIE